MGAGTGNPGGRAHTPTRGLPRPVLFPSAASTHLDTFPYQEAEAAAFTSSKNRSIAERGEVRVAVRGYFLLRGINKDRYDAAKWRIETPAGLFIGHLLTVPPRQWERRPVPLPSSPPFLWRVLQSPFIYYAHTRTVQSKSATSTSPLFVRVRSAGRRAAARDWV